MSRKSSPQKLGGLVEGFLARKGMLAACREEEVVQKWPQIVGERLAEVTECNRVEKGVLYVRVQSAAWRQEISYCIPELLKVIRAQTSCATITNIVLY